MASRSRPTIFSHLLYGFAASAALQCIILQDFVVPSGFDPLRSDVNNTACDFDTLVCTPIPQQAVQNGNGGQASPTYTPIVISVPPPGSVMPCLVGATVFLLASLVTLHCDLRLLRDDISRFREDRKAFFAEIQRLAQNSKLFADSVFWMGDLNRDDEEDVARNVFGVLGRLNVDVVVQDEEEEDEASAKRVMAGSGSTIAQIPLPKGAPTHPLALSVFTSSDLSGEGREVSGRTSGGVNTITGETSDAGHSNHGVFVTGASDDGSARQDYQEDENAQRTWNSWNSIPMQLRDRIVRDSELGTPVRRIDTIQSLSHQVGTSGRGLRELMEEENPSPSVLEGVRILGRVPFLQVKLIATVTEISDIVQALVDDPLADSVRGPAIPVFKHSKFKTLFYAFVCITFSFLCASLVTISILQILDFISASNGAFTLGLGGAYLYFLAVMVWIQAGLHLFNTLQFVYNLLRKRRKNDATTSNGNNRGNIKLSKGDLERLHDAHIFSIAVFSFIFAMNMSIWMLLAIQGWTFRWAEQWYYASITGIGFTAHNVNRFWGKVFCETVGVLGFFHWAFVLTLGAGMMLDRLRHGVVFLIHKTRSSMKVERKEFQGGGGVDARFVRWSKKSSLAIGDLEHLSRTRRFVLICFEFVREHSVHVVWMVFLLWLVGSIGFSQLEVWDFIDSSYFVVDILLTEGYNDFYPMTAGGRVFVYFYCLMSLGFWAVCVSMLIEKVQTVRLEIGRKQKTNRE
ncbi:hypothetical protein HDU98_000400 [Podochytrium sp. JEL0797]|nr:hypothetical protein HDU98_000400 [Podochytrium sp. JEL0797]